MAEQDANSIQLQILAIVGQPATPFPAFSGDELTAYNSVVTQLGGDPRNPEIFPPMTPTTLQDAVNPPPGGSLIPAAAWSAVMSQLTLELNYKTNTYNFFSQFYDFFNAVYVSNLSYLTTTAIPEVQAVGDETSQYILTALISAGGSAISAVGPPGTGVAVGLLNALVSYIQNSTNIPAGTILTDISSLGTSLSTNFQSSLTAIQTMEQAILNNWAALQMMGKDLQSATIAWPLPDDNLRALAITGNNIAMWQIILPEVWNIINYQGDPQYYSDTNWFASYIQANPNYYLVATPSGSGYNVTQYWLGRGTMVLNAKSPSDEMCIEIFTNLAVPRSDVFNQVNGWSGFSTQTFMVNGGCAASYMMEARAAATGASDTNYQQELDVLRQFRTQLLQSAMGTWYVSVYNAISDPIVDLYNNDPTVKEAIAQYDGESIWQSLMTLVSSGSWPAGTDVDTFIQNGLAIVSAVEQAADNAWGAGNIVDQAVNLALPYADTYVNVTTEAGLLQVIGTQTPPSPTFQPTKATGSGQ